MIIVKNRVLYFKKKIDFFLTYIDLSAHLAVACVTVLIWFPVRHGLNAFLRTVEMETTSFFQNVLAGIIAAIIPSTIAWILKKLNHRKTISPYLKSKLYCLLSNTYNNSGNEICKKIVPKIIHIFYHRKTFLVPSQKEMTEKLLNFITTPNLHRTKIAWVIGPAYSGKTTVAINLLEDLITKEKYRSIFRKVDRKIKYFDLSRPDFDAKALMDLEYNKLYDRLIIIDNFHKLPSEKCLTFAVTLREWPTFATIVLSRKPDEFLNQDIQIAKLEEEIDKGFKLILEPLDAQISSLTPTEYSSLIYRYNLSPAEENAAILFHLAGIVDGNSTSNDITQTFLDFYSGKPINIEMSQFFISVIAASIFSGGVSLEMLRNLVPDCDLLHHVHDAVNSGFLQPSPEIGDDYYLFHETLARYYIRHSYAKNRMYYRKTFKSLCKLHRYNIYQKFLYSVLLLNSEKPHAYDEVFLVCNYRNMLDQMNLIAELEPQAKFLYGREFGILYDRLGELRQASEAYDIYLSHGTNKADAILKLVQVNHQFYSKYEHEYPQMAISSDPYIRLLFKYWKAHIEMHKGIFSFDNFSEVVFEWEQHMEKILSVWKYEGLHLLRRTYFDYFRIYYMQGLLNYKKLELLKSTTLRARLSELPEFNAYYNKFILGHYIHYELMFELGIFNETASPEELNFVFGEKAGFIPSPNDMNCIMESALYFYKESYNFLEKIGDKTAFFVQCRYMEIQAARGLYEEAWEFFQRFYTFANQERNDYYLGCANLYMSKLLLIKRVDPTLLVERASSSLEHEIFLKLETAKKYFHSADLSNPYIDCYINLYEALLNYLLRSPQNPSQAKDEFDIKCEDLLCVGKKYNYFRFLKVLEFNKGKSLSFQQIYNIIRFFPFVAQ